MSARRLRSVCTTALVTATALTLVPWGAGGPGAGRGVSVAYGLAGSESGSGSDSDSGSGSGGAGTPGAPGAPGAAGPAAASGGIAGVLVRLQRLYQEAEEAGEAFNATDVELARLRADARRLGGGLDRARTALALSRNEAGRLAREQYQGRSGLSGYVRLLLARDPQSALDEGHLMERAARGRAATLARLTSGERRAGALADASRRALQRQQVLAARQKKQRDTVRARLGEVERMLASLTPGQLVALAALEKAATDKAQRELITSGALGNVPGASPAAGRPGAPGPAATGGPPRPATPSPRGGEALAYAVGQIGKPYEWGAEGPRSFDCSGLTSEAWARAGVAVPRTSQRQWRDLPRVPLNRLRPGDLVVYFPRPPMWRSTSATAW